MLFLNTFQSFYRKEKKKEFAIKTVSKAFTVLPLYPQKQPLD
jgi:hypothetical protein